jgi:hypothetical protein
MLDYTIMRSLTRRWHNPWHTSITLLAGAAVAFQTAPAAADCAPPASEVVWSYPANGDTNVPTNVDLWLQMSGWDGPAKVWLGDEALPGLALPYGYDLGELAPNTAYELRVEPLSGGVSFELGFTTGSGPASPNAGVAPGAVTTSRSSSFEGSALCRAALSTQDCFDTGQNTYFKFTPSVDTVGWLIQSDSGYRAINLWPGECGAPQLFAHDSSSPCVTLHAIDAVGATHASQRVCSDPNDLDSPSGPNDAGPNDVDSPSDPNDVNGPNSPNDASCTLPTTSSTQLPSTPLSLLGLALALTWRTRTRGKEHARRNT